MLNLESLRFVVDTSDLERAGKQIDELGNKLEKVSSRPSTQFAQATEKASKATKQMGDSAEAAAGKIAKVGKSTSDTISPVEALQKRLKNTFVDLSEGFTRGESSILNLARSLNASETQMKEFKSILQEISKLLKDPFDNALGAIRSVTKELELAEQRANLLKSGIALTTKQLQLYSRLSDEVAGKVKAGGLDPTQGEGLARYNKLLAEQQTKFLELAQSANRRNSEITEHNNLLKKQEELMKANATAGDAMVAQFRKIQEANYKEAESIRKKAEAQRIFNEQFMKFSAMGYGVGDAKRGAGMVTRGATEADVLAYLNSAKAQREATAAAKQKESADRKAAKAAAEREAAERSMGDAMVAQYRRRAKSIDDELRKLKEQRDALKAGSGTVTGNTVFRLTNLGASAEQIKQAKELRKEIEDLGKAARRSENPMKGFASVLRQLIPTLGALSGGALLAHFANEFIKTADYLTTFEARLNFLSKGTLDFNSSFEKLIDLSNEARVSVQDTGTFFSRLVPVMQSIGRSTNDAFTVTESFSKLLLVSGTSAREASAAMYQLSQALGKGKLDGDEFRTVAEATPELLRILEKQLGVTRAELYKMSEQGRLTSEVIINALGGALGELNKAAKDMPLTVEGALRQLGNEATALVKSVDDATNISGRVANMISSFADLFKLFRENEDVVVTVMGAIAGATVLTGVGLLANAIGGLSTALGVGGLMGILKGIASLAASNPVVAVLLGVGAIAGGVSAYQNRVLTNITDIEERVKSLRKTLNDPLSVQGMTLTPDDRKKLTKELADYEKKLSELKTPTGSVASPDRILDRQAREAAEKADKAAQDTLRTLGGFKGKYSEFIGELESLRDQFTLALNPLTEAQYNQAVKDVYEKYGLVKKKTGKSSEDKEAEKVLASYNRELEKAKDIAINASTAQDELSKSQRALLDLFDSEVFYKYTEDEKKAVVAAYERAHAIEKQAEAFKKAFEESEKARKSAEQYGQQLDEIQMANADVEEFVQGQFKEFEQKKKDSAFESSIFGMTSTEQEIARERYAIQKKLEEDILKVRSTKADQSVIDAEVEKLKLYAEQNEKLAEQNVLTKKNQETATKMADIFGNAFSDLILEGKSFGDVLQNLTKQVINLVFELLILEPLKASLKKAFSGFSLFSFLPFADGGVFSGGVQKFANGGAFTNQIVSSPTLFPMKNGTGMMGEAGPEAIMPLTRTSGGQLGVRMEGSAGSTVVMENNITIQVQGGNTNEETAAVVSQEMIKTMQGIARNEIVQAKRTGGVLR